MRIVAGDEADTDTVAVASRHGATTSPATAATGTAASPSPSRQQPRDRRAFLDAVWLAAAAARPPPQHFPLGRADAATADNTPPVGDYTAPAAAATTARVVLGPDRQLRLHGHLLALAAAGGVEAESLATAMANAALHESSLASSTTATWPTPSSHAVQSAPVRTTMPAALPAVDGSKDILKMVESSISSYNASKAKERAALQAASEAAAAAARAEREKAQQEAARRAAAAAAVAQQQQQQQQQQKEKEKEKEKEAAEAAAAAKAKVAAEAERAKKAAAGAHPSVPADIVVSATAWESVSVYLDTVK
ncbi:hypothetical protein HK405_012298, partial [Cladochytrium tenue]